MINECKDYMRQRLGDWKLPTGGDWTFLLYNNYHPQCTNIDLLWFHNGGKFPLAVTKLCRQEGPVRKEFDNLSRIRSWAPAWAPKPLGLVKQGEFWALWMEGIPGSPLSVASLTSPALQSLTGEIAAMHCAIRDNAGVNVQDRFSRMVGTPLDTVAGFGNDTAIAAGCAGLRERISSRWVESLPVIPQHGDLFPGNVLSHDNRWHVVDWESFGSIDLPFYDLLTLLLSMLMGPGERPDQWDIRMRKLVPKAVVSYAQALGLAAADIRLILPLVLANWFHFMRVDEREQFTTRMYRILGQYFRAAETWQNVFLGV